MKDGLMGQLIALFNRAGIYTYHMLTL